MGDAVIAVLGVDPTATGTGAAVLRVDGEVTAWWVWTLLKGGWRTRHNVPGMPVERLDESLDQVGIFVGEGVKARGVRDVSLVVEGLFAPPRWKKGASGKQVIVLAEGTGRTIAGLARYCGEPVARPSWKEWTAPYGLSRGTAKACENAVLEMARREGWLPRGLTVSEAVAVAEAGVMARWTT